ADCFAGPAARAQPAQILARRHREAGADVAHDVARVAGARAAGVAAHAVDAVGALALRARAAGLAVGQKRRAHAHEAEVTRVAVGVARAADPGAAGASARARVGSTRGAAWIARRRGRADAVLGARKAQHGAVAGVAAAGAGLIAAEPVHA